MRNISRRVVVHLLINISPPNVFKEMLLYGKYFQNRQASFGRSECKWVYVKCNPTRPHPLVSIQPSNHVNIIPDSMAQWQDCRSECWEAWGPEFNPRPGRVGATTENLHFLLFIVCRPNRERKLLGITYSFRIIDHAICVVCIYKSMIPCYHFL